MQIRRLSHQEIDLAIEFLQAMLAEMASFGGHVLQNPEVGANWFRDRLQASIETP